MITTKQIPKKIREAGKEGEKKERKGHERKGYLGVGTLSCNHHFFVGDNHHSLDRFFARSHLAMGGLCRFVLRFLCRDINCESADKRLIKSPSR